MGLKSQLAVSAVMARQQEKGIVVGASWWKKEGRNGPPDQVCLVCEEAKAAGCKVLPKRAHHPKCRSSRVYKKSTTATTETPPTLLGVPPAPAPPPTTQEQGGGTTMSSGQSLVMTGNTAGGGNAGTYHLTEVLLRTPARGVSYRRRPHPWQVVVCVWSVVVLNNSAPSLAVAGWLQDRYCDKFYS
jgi:hypothetical protein